MDTLEARRDIGLEQSYIERARELEPMLREAGDEIERGREVTPEIVEAMKERGIFRMLLPRSLGGAELDPLTYTEVLYTLAQGDGSTAWCLGQNSGCSMIAPYLPEETAREVFGDRDGILAWGPDLPGAGRTVVVEGGYRVTGRWGFATGSRHAKWLGCHTPLFDPDGSPRKLPNGRQQVRTMVFRKSEAQIIDNWQVLGLARHRQRQLCAEGPFRAAGLHRRPRQFRRIAREGAALPVHLGHDLRDEFCPCLDGDREGRVRRLYRDRARQGAPRRQGHIAREQRDPVAGLAMRGEAQIVARLSARRHRRDVGRGARRPARSAPTTTRSCGSRRPGRSTSRATSSRPSIRRPASTAIFENNPLERRMRDIHAGTQQGQGRQVHFETVGQIMMGLPPEGRMFR